MKIFLSYASQDRAQVELIRHALGAQDHDVFFDREDLSPGEAFDEHIRRAIEGCDLFVVALSPDTVDAGSYTLNEIELAQQAWPNASGRVLPVLLRPMPLEQLPPYLRSVTLLETRGNLPAAVAAAVHRLERARRRRRWLRIAVAAAVITAIGVSAWWARRTDGNVGRDGAPAVMIPGGKVIMGDDETTPKREVYVDEFLLDRFEITTARYAQFLQATGALQAPNYWEGVDLQRDGELPVVGVSWREADAYCRWAERRLPTEAEWERAARSDDARLFPWGDAAPSSQHAHFGGQFTSAPYEGGLSAVGGHAAGASPFGVQDLAGNAAEWVADWYAESFSSRDVRNPVGPDTGPGKVIRGGGWYDPPERLRASSRFYASPDESADDTGFRCASDVR